MEFIINNSFHGNENSNCLTLHRQKAITQHGHRPPQGALAVLAPVRHTKQTMHSLTALCDQLDATYNTSGRHASSALVITLLRDARVRFAAMLGRWAELLTLEWRS